MNPTISFEKKNRPFQKTLNQRVNQYFQENNLERTANLAMYLKSALFLSMYFGLITLIYLNILPLWANWFLCILLGLTVAGIGFNVMHDGAHGAYSRKKWLNELMGATMNLIGGDVVIWKKKHNHIHHSHTNIEGSDQDIAHNPVFRMNPFQPKMWFHQFQHIYCFVIYGLSSFLWVYGLDFVKYFTQKVGYHPLSNMKAHHHLTFWATKISYTFIFLIFPAQIYGWTYTLIGFFTMHFILGNTLSIIFQLAHVVEEAEFHNIENGNLEVKDEWAVHQIKTTANFATTSAFWTWFTGGLNHQVEHHLFPQICHVHYPALRPIVQETCKEQGLDYLEAPTFLTALKSHLRQMHNAGKAPAYQPQAVPKAA